MLRPRGPLRRILRDRPPRRRRGPRAAQNCVVLDDTIVARDTVHSNEIRSRRDSRNLGRHARMIDQGAQQVLAAAKAIARRERLAGLVDAASLSAIAGGGSNGSSSGSPVPRQTAVVLRQSGGGREIDSYVEIAGLLARPVSARRRSMRSTGKRASFSWRISATSTSKTRCERHLRPRRRRSIRDLSTSSSISRRRSPILSQRDDFSRRLILRRENAPRRNGVLHARIHRGILPDSGARLLGGGAAASRGGPCPRAARLHAPRFSEQEHHAEGRGASGSSTSRRRIAARGSTTPRPSSRTPIIP